MISQLAAYTILFTFGATMFTTSTVSRRSKGLDLFLVAERSVGTWTGAMSVASTWIWAPALFLAAQKAYQQGLPGLMWFTVPNVGCLVLFAFLAPRIRKVFPKGYTLPQYIASRFDAKTHIIYLFFISLSSGLLHGGSTDSRCSAVERHERHSLSYGSDRPGRDVHLLLTH